MTTTSRAMKEVLRHVAGERCVCIVGKPDSLVLIEGEPVDVRRGIENLCSEMYDVVVRFDAVNGPTVLHGGELWQPDPNDPRDPMLAIHELMMNDAFSAAVIVHQTGIVLQEPANHDVPERMRVAIVESAVTQAATIGSQRNCMVLLAGCVTDVPAYLLHTDRLALVHLGSPDRRELRHFIVRELRRMHGGKDLDQMSLDRLADAYTKLMTGRTIRDFESVASFSAAMKIDVADPRMLLHAHRCGETADYWGAVRTDLPLIAAELAASVYGQRAAIDAVVAGLAGAALGLNMTGDPHDVEIQPRAVLLLLGSTGVGKTEVAKASARALFGDQSAYVRIDMATLAQEHAADRLTGSPPGYVGFETGGELTNAFFARPYGVLLLDEIEKAHPRTLDRLMSVLDDGRITDAHGNVAYCGDWVIIMTSNIGSVELTARSVDGGVVADAVVDLSALSFDEVEQHFTASAERYFVSIGRPELWSRLKQGAVAFQPLNPAVIREIAEKCIRDTTFVHGPALRVDVDSAVAFVQTVLADPANRNLGGRQVRNCLRSAFLTLASWIVLNGHADAEELCVTFHLDGALDVIVDQQTSTFVPASGPHGSTQPFATANA